VKDRLAVAANLVRTSVVPANAALAVSGAAFLVVLFSPAPRAARKPSGTSAESVALLVQAEINATDRDGSDLASIAERARVLDEMYERRRERAALDVEAVVREAVEKELARRWREFEQRLSVLKLYEKRKKGKD
jgi:hypothetical protein